MQISALVEQIKKSHSLPQAPVLCFTGVPSYPLLFFHHLLSFFKQKNIKLEMINCADIDMAALKAMISTIGFSGSALYWLENVYTLSEKKQQEIMIYLSNYQGPHQIILFVEKGRIVTSNSDSILTISLPERIMLKDFPLIRYIVSKQLSEKSSFSSQLCMYSDYLSLENMCLLAHYELVLGKKSEDFFLHWITRIIDPTSSLFILSQHFFAKNAKSFFRQWATLSEQYVSVFWVSFWADQIWRAYVYCDLMQQNKYAKTKKNQYKLPFSFINRDWSRYELDELREAYACLTAIDFRLKNGGSDILLEHFYNQFFDNKFMS